MTIKVGDRLPNATFMTMTADGPKPKTTDEVFKGRKVVLFAVPGAFTPTCHKNHLPGFVHERRQDQGQGRRHDRRDCGQRRVRDGRVVEGQRVRGQDRGARRRQRRLREGDRPLGRSGPRGLGTRSQRYAMLVDDGVVKTLNVEDAPGKADISGAENLLKGL